MRHNITSYAIKNVINGTMSFHNPFYWAFLVKAFTLTLSRDRPEQQVMTPVTQNDTQQGSGSNLNLEFPLKVLSKWTIFAVLILFNVLFKCTYDWCSKCFMSSNLCKLLMSLYYLYRRKNNISVKKLYEKNYYSTVRFRWQMKNKETFLSAFIWQVNLSSPRKPVFSPNRFVGIMQVHARNPSFSYRYFHVSIKDKLKGRQFS